MSTLVLPRCLISSRSPAKVIAIAIMNRRLCFSCVLAFSAILLGLPSLLFSQDGHSLHSSPMAQTEDFAPSAPVLGPQPPCARDAVPPYPAVDEPASVKSWSDSDLGHSWNPPACTGWTEEGFTTLVT